MSDLRVSFPVLEDSATQAGLPLHKVQDGDAYAGKNALPALVAKDASGNLHYLITDGAGNLFVNIDGAGTPKKGRGLLVGTASVATVFDIPLVAGKTYSNLSWVVSCFRDAVFEIVHINDPAGTPTEEHLADVLVGSGDFTDSGNLKDVEFVAGATSPVLRVRAYNQNALSDMRAAVTIKQED